MNQLEQLKQELIQNWQHDLHTVESGWDEDHEAFEKYLNQIITKAYLAGQQAERKVLKSDLGTFKIGFFKEFDYLFDYVEDVDLTDQTYELMVNKAKLEASFEYFMNLINSKE